MLVPLLFRIPLALAPDEPSKDIRIRQIMPGDWTSEEIRKQASTLIRQLEDKFHPMNISAWAGYDKESVRQRRKRTVF